jgi:hypothetical protein
MRVLEVAGGWSRVLEDFESDEIAGMRKWGSRFMVLLIDFDGHHDRLEQAKGRIPDDLTDRVFILGVFSEPEDLKPGLGSFEAIGSALARDCREGANVTWNHDLLRHNCTEVDRLRDRILPILFG